MNRLDLVGKASFTVREIAARNSVHVSTVNRWIKSGKLKSLRIGGSRRITIAQEGEFLYSHEPDFNVTQPQPIGQGWGAST